MTTTRGRIATFTLGLALLFGATAQAAQACEPFENQSTIAIVPQPATWGPVEDVTTFTPCATDEAPTGGLCYWDAQARGDGNGTSFVAGSTPDGSSIFWRADGTVEAFGPDGEPTGEEVCETLTVEDGYVFCEG
jgi:hypothetical protein